MGRSELLLDYFLVQPWSESVKGHFGLIDVDGEGWAGFKKKIEELQKTCKTGETIKVVYAARHGQAEHNLLEAELGLEAAFPLYKPDPELTSLGVQQAAELGQAFKREVNDGLPIPERFFVSPLTRAGQTLGQSWGWSVSSDPCDEQDWGCGVKATVIEDLREHLHVNLCDKRSPISSIKKKFPSFDYSMITSDEDNVWKPTGRETDPELIVRAGRGFEAVLDHAGDATHLSLTAHSGYLRSLFGYFGVEQRRLEPGEMQILVVRSSTSSDGEVS